MAEQPALDDTDLGRRVLLGDLQRSLPSSDIMS